MGRPEKLVHRRQAREAVAAIDQCTGVAREVAGLHETPTTTGTADFANSAHCAAAPARGGSKITASKDFISTASNGRRIRSRTSVVNGLKRSDGPCSRAARASAASDEVSLSTA